MGEAHGGVDSLLITIHLGTERASREWMIWIATNPDGFSSGDLNEKTTGIRTVIRANRPFHLFEHENLLGHSLKMRNI
jgi:hypothetical protein